MNIISMRLLMVLGLSLLGAVVSLLRADGGAEAGPNQSFEVTTTDRTSFAPGGIVHVEGSYGYLAVEGWDEPEVEVAVIKQTNSLYPPSLREREEQRFDRIHVVMAHRTDKELTILTTPPLRKSLFFVPRPMLPSARHGLTPDYRIHIPRNSQLFVNHDNGYVWVSEITGDIEVHCHTGDMIVALSDPGSYSIDARTGLGSVSSDFTGKGHRYLAGTRFVHTGTVLSHRIYLRMDRGGITVLRGPSPGRVLKDSHVGAGLSPQ